MDLLSLIFAAALAAGASAGTALAPGGDAARSHIIDIGADSTSPAQPAPTPTPGDGEDAKSHIIEIG